MTKFVDDAGSCLIITMKDRANGLHFENKFFELGFLDMDSQGRYEVDDVEHLIAEARAAWACLGDYSNGEPNAFDLVYIVVDASDESCIWQAFDSKYIAMMAEKFDVSVEACI